MIAPTMEPHLYERVDVTSRKIRRQEPRERRKPRASDDNDCGIMLSLPLLLVLISALFYLVVYFPNYSDGILGPPKLAHLAKENLQDRAIVHLGTRAHGFHKVNHVRLDKRRNDMADLEDVRFSYCGDFKVGRWTEIKTNDSTGPFVVYANNSLDYAKMRSAGNASTKKGARHRKLRRWLCERDHPRLANTQVRIERIGPFYSNGGYDWNTVSQVDDVLNFSRSMRAKTLYVVGRMVANVHRDGTIIGYPPLRSRYSQVYPDQSKPMRTVLPTDLAGRYGLPDSNGRHALFQARSDTICKGEDGGVACLLEQLPRGQGYRIVNTTGFVGHFQVNDVRAKGAPRLEFYVDVAVVYTMEKRIATTSLQIGNPSVGPVRNAYIMPLDSSSNVMFFNFTNYFLGNGVLNDFALHTRMAYFDSVYVFKGDTVYAKLEALRERWNRSLPVVFECLSPWKVNPKRALLELAISAPGTTLVCEGVRPSMEPYCETEDVCTYLDKSIEFNCRTNVRLGVNETLTVLAFNKIRNTSTIPITRDSTEEELAIASSFGAGFSSMQHSYFRADFVSDRAREGGIGRPTGDTHRDIASGNFAPPALSLFSTLPYTKLDNAKDAERVIASCPQTINFKLDRPRNA